MTNHDLDEEIDQLAVEIEKKIAEGEKLLDDLPDFEPRSKRSRKLQRKVGKKP